MLIAIWLAVAPLLLIDASWLAAATPAKAPAAAKSSKSSKTSTAPKAAKEDWNTDTVDQDWVAKVLADPTYDKGWSMQCGDDWGDELEAACDVRELAYSPGGRPIAIRGGANSGMTVMGWDRKDYQVVYRVRARAETEEEAKELLEEISVEVANGVMRPRGPSSSHDRSWAVEIKVWVPRSSDLSLTTHNGPIGIRGVSGTMDIRSVNGPVALTDLSGAVMARVQNGPLAVDLSGSKWNGAGLDAECQNGPIALRVPKNYSAKLQTGTINGPSDIEYPLTVEGRLRGHFTTTLGSGGPMVRVVTDNGPLHIAQR